MTDSDFIDSSSFDWIDDINPYDVVQVAFVLGREKHIHFNSTDDITNLYSQSLDLLINAYNVMQLRHAQENHEP